jgi:Chitin binding Peritrophin-A domain
MSSEYKKVWILLPEFLTSFLQHLEFTILILSAVLVQICTAQQFNPCFNAQTNLVSNPHGQCEDYFQCVNGRAVAMRCPNGLFFDVSRQVCNFPSVVTWCTNNSWQPTIGPMPTVGPINPQQPSLRPPVLPGSVVPTSCRRQVDGMFIPDRRRGCDAYMLCRNGRGTPDRCPSPYFFDFGRQMCNWREQVDCGV